MAQVGLNQSSGRETKPVGARMLKFEGKLPKMLSMGDLSKLKGGSDSFNVKYTTPGSCTDSVWSGCAQGMNQCSATAYHAPRPGGIVQCWNYDPITKAVISRVASTNHENQNIQLVSTYSLYICPPADSTTTPPGPDSTVCPLQLAPNSSD